MAKESKKSSGRSAEKKIARAEKNEAQHKANLDTLRELGIAPRIRTTTIIRRDNKGHVLRDNKGSIRSFEKSYEVRPSKLIRTERRARAGH